MSQGPSSSVSRNESDAVDNPKPSRVYSWSPPADGKCYYPVRALAPELDFTRSCRRLYVSSKFRREWAGKALARAFIEDETLYEGLEKALLEVPLDPSQPYSVRSSMVLGELGDGLMGMIDDIELYVLSYVHQAATSTYGLAKIPEPAERELIDGIRRRAKANKTSRVFIWSDQTIKGRVSEDVWLKVGVFAYAVLPGIILATPGYTDRLWPLVEYSLLEACSGFIVDLSASARCKNFNTTIPRDLVGSSVEWIDNQRSLSCAGQGNTIRNGLLMMASRFLTTQLGMMETHYQNDRLFLRDVSVSLLKSDKSASIGHYLMCPETCKFRQEGNLYYFLSGVSTRALHRTDNTKLDFEHGCALWESSTFSSPSVNVFRSKGGFLQNVSDAAVSSAWRSLLKVDGIAKFFLAIRTLSSKFQFSSTQGYIGTLYVLNFNFDGTHIDKNSIGQPYWGATPLMAWIELEADCNGNQNWPGASLRLDQVSSTEIDCLMRIQRRFWGEEDVAEDFNPGFEMLRRRMMGMMSTLPQNDFTTASLLQLDEMKQQRSKTLIAEEVLDIIGQEIEKFAMVQNTGELQLTNVEWKMPYNEIEKVDGELKLSITRSTNKKRTRSVVNGEVVDEPFDPTLTMADYWIYLGNENAKELVGMGGRICMSAALAGVGSKAVIEFIEKENLRESGIEENRGVGKNQSFKDWRYMKYSTGYWRRLSPDKNDDDSLTGYQLPRHAIVGGSDVQERYA